MKIKILGTIGKMDKRAPLHSKHSGILIDDLILFDLGEKEFLDYNPKAIFLTHFHADHAFFIDKGNLKNLDIPIYAPENFMEFSIIKVLKKPIKVKSFEIEPIPTHHSKLIESQGYLIKKDERKILYTGDLTRINKEFQDKLINLDLVITDAGFIRKGGMIRADKETGQLFGHNGIPDLVDFFKAFTDHIIFTHFGSWFFKDIEKSKKDIIAMDEELNIEVAYDGFEFSI